MMYRFRAKGILGRASTIVADNEIEAKLKLVEALFDEEGFKGKDDAITKNMDNAEIALICIKSDMVYSYSSIERTMEWTYEELEKASEITDCREKSDEMKKYMDGYCLSILDTMGKMIRDMQKIKEMLDEDGSK